MKILKEILGEELYNQVIAKTAVAEVKVDIISEGKESLYIPKAKFDEEVTKKNTYKTELDSVNTKVKDLEKVAKDNETLTAKIAEMGKDKEAFDAKLKDVTITNAVKLAAVTAKAIDPDVVSMLVDKTKIEVLADGTVKGLDDQLKGLAESKKYLFGEQVPGGAGANPPGGGGNNETELQKLQTDYDNALKTGNTAQVVFLKNKMFELQQKK